MTEPDAPDPINPIPTEPPERVRIDGPPSPRRRDYLPLLYLLGFLVLAGSLFYLYLNPSTPPGVEQEAARVDTLQQQIEALSGRLTTLEQRPAPAPAPAAPSIAPLEARIAALEPRISTLEPKLAALEPKIAALEPKLAGLEPQVAALEPKISALEPKITALEERPAPPPPDFGPITAQIDTGLAKQDAELSKQASDLQGLATRLNTVEGRVAAVEKQDSAVTGQISGLTGEISGLTSQIGGVAERAQRTSLAQAAAAALEAGHKLGQIPGAPPALARFATDAPPTEAALRLSFNTAAEAAQNASQPAIMDNQPFASRLWTRAQQSVSVRQGDHVLLGDPVSGVLAHARQALEAGDLAGAVSALDKLAGPAASAMADWVGQARALLEARAALATMAARG